MKALVLGGESRAALAVTRSLGRAGVRVRVGSSRAESLAGQSRYAAGRLVYSDPSASAACEEALLREDEGHPGQVWYPITDPLLERVNGLRDRLRHAVLPLPSAGALQSAQDKWNLLRLARAAGLDAPESYLPRDRAELEDLMPRLRFPVILKPRFSRRRVGDRLVQGKVLVFAGPRELRAAWEAESVPPILQDWVPGFGMGLFFLAREGRVLARFAHRRLREKPPCGGVSVLCESITFPAALAAPAEKLLRDLDWHGVCMIEFRVDGRDGVPRLMEINPRFWGSLQLAVDAGVDFPRLLHRMALGETVEAVRSYRVGVRCRWELGDLDHLLIRLRGRGGPESPPCSRWRALEAFLNPFAGRPEIASLPDPKPFFWELREYAKRELRECFR